MALDCPRCQNVSLEEIEVGEIIVDRCPRCAGIWFDNAEISEIIGRQFKVTKFESVVPKDEFSDKSMGCPRCEGVSLRKFGCGHEEEEQGCTVYRCVSCIGSWLDRGELREIEDGRLEESLKAYFTRVE
ncbi:MAG: zf-TFIIB domain-containing protein [Proteobacteria bacterium]|nr:zf-TFIIB domain-containing protein [Pseudomonadota bacterium]